MKKILFIVDIRDWAYDDQAKNWKAKFENTYDIDILYLKDHPPASLSAYGKNYIASLNRNIANGEEVLEKEVQKDLYQIAGELPGPVFDHNHYDGLVFFYSNALLDSRLSGTVIPPEKTAIFINNEKWVPMGAAKFVETFAHCKVIIGCNKFIVDEFSKVFPNVYRASQLVNDEVFYSQDRKKFDANDVVVGFSGSVGNPYKNFEMIQAAAEMAGVKLRKATSLTRPELNDWYSNIDILICASTSEGGPMCLLEAGITKTPIISTNVGLAREILTNKTGIVTELVTKDIARNITNVSNNYNEAIIRAENMHNVINYGFTYNRSIDLLRVIYDITTGQ